MEGQGLGKNNMGHVKSFLNGGQQPPPAPAPEPSKEEPTAIVPPQQPPTEPKAADPAPAPFPSLDPVEGGDPDPGTEPPSGEQPTASTEDPKNPLELDDNIILGYFKDKHGKEFTSIDDMFKPVSEQSKDPWEGVSDEVVQFKKYNEETGRGFDDFMNLNRDVSKMDPIQLAREKVGGIIPDLTTKQIDEYLETKLNIDVSNPNDMSVNDRIDLENFVKDYRTQLKQDQEKYKTPVERPDQPAKVELKDLGNGIKMSEEDFNKFETARNQYINGLKSSMDKIANSTYDVEVDDNGVKKTIQVAYDYSKEDKHKMVSHAMDTQLALEKLFTNKDGLDHVGIQQAMFWADPELRAKAISSLIHKSRADLLQEVMASRSNARFGPQPSLPKNGAQTKTVAIPGTQSYGIKHDFSKYIKK